MGVVIRVCHKDEVALLDAQFPYTDDPDGHGCHADRLARQELGKITYLVAFDGKTPVGHLVLNWNGSAHEHVRRPDVPEIQRLRVHAAWRGQHVGRALLRAAEAHALVAGRAQVCLTVDVANHHAISLYESEGYRDWGGGTFPSGWKASGVEGEPPTKYHATHMLKSLTREHERVAEPQGPEAVMPGAPSGPALEVAMLALA